MARNLVKPKPARLEDLVEEIDVEQGSEEWRALHVGVPSAGIFRAVMAESREGPDTGVRASLLHRMAAEIIFERPMETFSNADMDRGREQEPWLLEQYETEQHRKAFARNATFPGLRRVGFIKRTIRDPLMEEPLVVGCSPDALVEDDGMVETKSMRPNLLVKLLDSGRFPGEHRWQCQGSLWVSGRAWCDLRIGYEEFPLRGEWRIQASDTDAQTLRNQCERFMWDLRKLVERVRAKGGAR
jgi:hypothetical protein